MHPRPGAGGDIWWWYDGPPVRGMLLMLETWASAPAGSGRTGQLWLTPVQNRRVMSTRGDVIPQHMNCHKYTLGETEHFLQYLLHRVSCNCQWIEFIDLVSRLTHQSSEWCYGWLPRVTHCTCVIIHCRCHHTCHVSPRHPGARVIHHQMSPALQHPCSPAALQMTTKTLSPEKNPQPRAEFKTGCLETFSLD